MRKRDISHESQTDWNSLREIADEEIDLTETPEVTPEMFKQAVIRRRLKPVQVIICRERRTQMSELMKRITINPEQCGGRPCIRGMRIRVIDVLDLLAAGLATNEVLEELPDLEAEDIQASLQYAAIRLDHPRLAA